MLDPILFLLGFDMLVLVLAWNQFLETFWLPHFIHVDDGVSGPNIHFCTLARGFWPWSISSLTPFFLNLNLAKISFIFTDYRLFIENGHILSQGLALLGHNRKGPFLLAGRIPGAGLALRNIFEGLPKKVGVAMHFVVSGPKFVERVISLANVHISAFFDPTPEDTLRDVVGMRVPRLLDPLENQIEFGAVQRAIPVSVKNIEKFKHFRKFVVQI